MYQLVKTFGYCSLVMALSAGQLAFSADSPLMKAVQGGDVKSIKSLLKARGTDVNKARADGTTPLAWAVYENDREVVEALLKSGADVNAANEYGVTPLSLACLNSNPAIIHSLLDAGADVDKARINGETPLMACANTGDVEGVRALIKHGANVNVAEDKTGQTALMWATAEQHPAVIRILVNNGADVHARSRTIKEPAPYVIDMKPGESIWGSNYPPTIRFQKISGDFTALHFAAQQGNVESARVLLDAGADVNAPHPEHGSPLVIAVASGHDALAQFLLERGADPNIKDAWGISPLHYALQEGLFMLAGASPKPTDKVGWTRKNLNSLVEVLLDYGADANARIEYAFPFQDNYFLARSTSNPAMISPVGATPILLAAVSADIEAMNMLEELSDIHATTSGGATLFLLATGAGPEKRAMPRGYEQKSIEAAKLAMEWEAGGVNDRLTHLAEDGPRKGVKDDRTALHFATFRGWKEMVKFLVKNGADINARDRYGMTPLMIALGDPEGRYYRQIGDGDYDHRFRRPGVTPGTGANEEMAELLLSLGAEPFTGKYFDASGY